MAKHCTICGETVTTGGSMVRNGDKTILPVFACDRCANELERKRSEGIVIGIVFLMCSVLFIMGAMLMGA